MNKVVWDYLDKKSRYRNDVRSHNYKHKDYDDDYEDERAYRRNYADMEELELSKRDINAWENAMRNSDGTKGAHYDMQQVSQSAEKLGIKFKDFDERELCVATNMFYSDYCTVLAKYVPHDEMLHACVELAKAFLDDEDAPEGSEKLALYYHCIVNSGLT